MTTPLMTQSAAPMDMHEVLAEWRQAVEALNRQVAEWSRDAGWKTEQEAVTVTEQDLGAYELPSLRIEAEPARLYLEPVARFVMGAKGRVDLFSWPSLVRVMLLRKDDHWIIRPELGPPWPKAWGKDTFIELARILLEEA